MARHHMTRGLGRRAVLMSLACVAATTVRATSASSIEAKRGDFEAIAISETAPVAAVGIGSLKSAAMASPPIDRRARQIVAAHPIIPTPSAVLPALVGLAFVARRVVRASPRSTIRYR